MAAEKISISLSGELLDSVKAAVASGYYSTTSEVVRDALRKWQEERAEALAKFETLKTELRQALKDDANPLDWDDIDAAVAAKFPHPKAP